MTKLSGEEKLRGNGVALVREREIARRVQFSLARLYRLETLDDVRDYIQQADAGERETLLVRESHEGLELSLRLAPLDASERELDGLCQLIEGVSHFVYIAERAQVGRSTTQLELEIQAEVDKYVVLVGAMANPDLEACARIRERLYEQVAYVHEAGSDSGDRYRVANQVAKRFTRKVEREFLARRRIAEMRGALREFFQMGQAEKLRA